MENKLQKGSLLYKVLNDHEILIPTTTSTTYGSLLLRLEGEKTLNAFIFII
jgi:hypothetical protein